MNYSLKTNLKIGWFSAASLVVANMIGTGVFTSLGFQLEGLSNSYSILLLWIIGGVIALSGAFSYAELGSAMSDKSGGEYHFISEIYNKFIGYLAGWISLTVGFAAPVALAAMAFGVYISHVYNMNSILLASLAVIVLSLIHSFNLKQSSLFQNIATILKIVLILLIIVVGFGIEPTVNYLHFEGGFFTDFLSPFYAVSLIYVSYAYSGWNAAAYIVEEIDDVNKNLPKALIRGTLLVGFLYVLLHYIFLRHLNPADVMGKVDIGHAFAKNVLGITGGEVISAMIAFFLLSSISAMVWVGPRVSLSMSKDYSLWKFLGKKNKDAIPVYAIWFQALLSLVMIWTGTFEEVLLYCGFLLQLSAALCVLGGFVIRLKNPQKLKYKNPFYPILPFIFILFSIWILVFLIIEQPWQCLLGLTNLLIGTISYFISKKISV